MGDQYELLTTKEFDRSYRKITKNNNRLKVLIDAAIIKLLSNPFDIRLRTHKANTRSYGVRYSSRVTGDIRIIWDFIDKNKVILAITMGGHSGRNKIYK